MSGVVEEVHWLDVGKTMNDDEFDASQDVDSRLSPIKTIGWVYEESEKTLMLVQEFADGVVRDHIVIPKALIVKRKKLK
jgi:hypothetical protein